MRTIRHWAGSWVSSRPRRRAARAGRPPTTRSAHAVAEARVPVQRRRALRQRRVPVGDPVARPRAGRADRDVPRVTAEAALELRIADRDEAARLRHALE